MKNKVKKKREKVDNRKVKKKGVKKREIFWCMCAW